MAVTFGRMSRSHHARRGPNSITEEKNRAKLGPGARPALPR